MLLTPEIERALSKDPQQRYDEIQRLTFYLNINGHNLIGIAPEVLMNMPEVDLIKESVIEKSNNDKKRKLQDYEAFIVKDIFGDDGIKCRKCGYIVEANSKQTRSADEGATVFISCSNCGTRFKMSS